MSLEIVPANRAGHGDGLVDVAAGRRSPPRTRGLLHRIRARLRRLTRRKDLYPQLEIIAAAATIVIGWSSYALLAGGAVPANGLSPPAVTALLLANLLPLMLLVVLIARRFAILFANRRKGLAGSRLHVRMVALFATIAAVPTLLVVIFASLLFQFGVQFWFSDRVKTVLDGSNEVAQAYVEENRQSVAEDIVAMAIDMENYATDFGLGSLSFGEGLRLQIEARKLSEAAIVGRGKDGTLTPIASAGIKPAAVIERLSLIDLDKARVGAATVVAQGADRVEAVVATSPSAERYIYVSRKVDPAVLARAAPAAQALGEYRALIERSRVMQLRFNLVLIGVSLLTLAVAIWFALWLANRLVAPIARLAEAAERVGAGDLDARVPVRGSPDEIGTLARSFNRMTSELKAQQRALLSANQQLDARRQFTEAVLSGVSAGVLSIAPDGQIRAANRSAADLLESSETALTGQMLSDAVPELATLLAEARRTGDAAGNVRIARGSDTQTLSVRIAAETAPGSVRAAGGGYVLTFDDISAQLSDQRRAAWADVARRIAHEIKNPLTPIQLAAERLQRKFGRQIADDPETFAVLTATIVRQVGDLRRMVVTDPAVDEASLRVELALLQRRVEHPEVGGGVRAAASDPLPGDRVVRLVGVHQSVPEPRLAVPPGLQQVLGQEGRHHHPRPVVHPPGLPQLAHAGIHHVLAGATLLPGRQQVPVGAVRKVSELPAQRCGVKIRVVVGQVPAELAPVELALPRQSVLGDEAAEGVRGVDELAWGHLAAAQPGGQLAGCLRVGQHVA